MPKPPKDFTILVDDREKRPLPFPDTLEIADLTYPLHLRKTRRVFIHTKSTRLPTGDYLLMGHEHAVCIERKASFDELDTNLQTSKGRDLFVAELHRLRTSFSRPYLFLEGDPHNLTITRGPHTNASCTRDTLLFLLNSYNISFQLIPTKTPTQRRAAGTWIAALLLSGIAIPPPSEDKKPCHSSPESNLPSSSTATASNPNS